MRYQFLTGWLLLVSSQDVESGFGDTFPELQEDILLLQMDVKLSRGLTQTAYATSVSEGFQAADSESPALLSESFKSEVEGGVMFGPKTSAALFLLSSCTFGLLCLCGAKPFITAPCLVLKLLPFRGPLLNISLATETGEIHIMRDCCRDL